MYPSPYRARPSAIPAIGLGAALSVLATASALGQAAPPPRGEEEVVVVTATRIPLPASAMAATVQVITPEETRIQAQIGGSAVDAVAALVPSFSPTRQKLTGAGESLRGRSPLFLIDAVPQSTPLRDGSRDGFTVDPFFVDRVEVIFGSNAIQGIGATGGVINYVTVRPASGRDGWTGAALAQLSAAGDIQGEGTGWKLAARTGRDFGAVDLMLGGAVEARGAFYDGRGLRLGVDGTQGELQDSRSWSLFAKAGFEPAASQRIELMVNYFELAGDGDYVVVAGNRATGLPTSAVRGAQTGEVPFNTALTASLSWQIEDVFGGSVTAKLFGTRFESLFGGGVFADFQDPRIDPTRTLFDQSSNHSQKAGFRVDWTGSFEIGDGLQVLVGLDGLRDTTYQELARTGRLWVPEATYQSLAPVVQLNQSLMDGRLNLSAGARYEDATLDVGDYDTLWFYGPQRVGGGEPAFGELLSNAGISFEPVDGFVLYASAAQGFTLADVGRILRAVSMPGQDVDRFLDVTPVISDNLELGVELDAGAVRAGLAWFRSTSDRGALLVLTAGDFYEVQRQRTEIEGFDLTLRWQTPVDGLVLSLAASSLMGKTDNTGDGQVETDLTGPNIAPDRTLLAADWRRGPVSARIQLQDYEARRFTGGDPRNDFEGYSLVDAYVRLEAGPGAVSLSVSNLTDESYISYNSDTERPTDNLRFFAGRGRTMTLAYDVRF